MGISGIGSVDKKLNIDKNIDKSKMSESQAPGADIASEFFAAKNSATDEFVSNPIKKSPTEINNALQQVLEEFDEKNMTFWEKSLDCVKSFFSTPKSIQNPYSFSCSMRDAYYKAKNVYAKAVSNLKTQGVDIDSLSDADKMEYLGILVNHAVQNISNSEFLQNLRKMNVRRAQEETRSHIPDCLVKFTSFLKERFSAFFAKTAKMDIAALKTAMSEANASIANELMSLYINTLEEDRCEILNAALNELPEGFDEQSIIEFALTSENMTDEQINFARALIDSSNLSDDEKEEKLRILEKQQKLKRDNTMRLARDIIRAKKEFSYKYHMNVIDSCEVQIDEINEKKAKMKRKIAQLSEKKSQWLEKQYIARKKFEQEKRRLDKFDRNGKKCKQKSPEYEKLESYLKDIENNIGIIEAEIYLLESRTGMLDDNLSRTIDKIDSNLIFAKADL